ncbi:MAG: hypothetical protein IJH84_08300 [Saccharopolyspora sp.]|uniref:shikimate kinase n=1 Tax=Saccharopolyspora sp. TaxID=33915 RepID=UPI0025E4B7F4|nr:shikimate kinase [Saccharopolyspora sp.]MBQ6641020.1 hypothetical protein [Saccharopolyspora sp.]
MTEVFDFRKSSDESADRSYKLVMPVFFVGFMGAGKTSVARKLARSAGVTAVDMDTYIARSCDMKVKQIFAETGEEGFRQIETDVLRELARPSRRASPSRASPRAARSSRARSSRAVSSNRRNSSPARRSSRCAANRR